MTMKRESHDPIRPEDLVAHAEGRLPAGSALRARIEEHLRHDPEAAARVAAYRRQDTLLHEAFDHHLQQPLPPSVHERLERSEEARPRWALAATLVIGIAAGWSVAQVEFPPGGGNTAPDTRAEPVAGSGVDSEAGMQSSAQAVLRPEGAPDLSAIGLTSTGQTALEDPAAGLRRFEYRNADGRILQLLVTQDPLIDPASVYTLQSGDFSLAYWHRGDRTYLLTGAIDSDRLQALAHETMVTLAPDEPAVNGGAVDSGVVAGNQEAGEGESPSVDEAESPTPVIDQM